MKLRKSTSFYFALLRFFYFPFEKAKYHYKLNKYKLDKKKPYIILSNHTAQLDPLFLVSSFNRPIQFVMLDIMFDTFLGKVLKVLANPIAKEKDVVDVSTIRNMYDVIKQNGVVGLFPSGDCTCTGIESKIDPSIAKLVKKLNAEVILYKTTGLFGIRPRFSKKIRKGKSSGNVVDVITTEELQILSNEEIYSRITNALYCDQVKENKDLFKSKASAEYLEKVLYVCPDCFSISSLESSGNEIKCRKCGFSATYNERMRFVRNNAVRDSASVNNLETIAEWNEFQNNLAGTFVKKCYDPYDAQNNKIIVTDQIKYLEFRKRRKRRSKYIRRYKNGYITLYANRIEIFKDMNIINIPLNDAKLSYQMRSILVIYTSENTYKVYGKDRINFIKYIQLVDAMHKEGIIK